MNTRTSMQPEPAVPPSGPALAPAPALPTHSGVNLEVVTGRTMRAALLAARREFGDRAVVIDQRTEAGVVTLAVSTEVPRSTDSLAEMRADAGRLLTPALAPPPASVEPARTPLADVERRLREHGASKKLRERVLESVASKVETGHPLDLAAEEVGRAFDIASLPMTKGQLELIALVGQTGVGKTTTLAKLALRLARAGRRVVLATLDAERVGAAEQLRGFGEMLRLPTVSLRDPERLAGELAKAPGRFDVVLIDGSGDLSADAAALDGLRAACLTAGLPCRLAPLVVLSATSSSSAHAAATRALAALEPVGAIVTKVDEAAEPVAVLEHANANDLGLAFVTNGPEIGPHFHRANAERFADLALIGRIG